MENCEHIEMWDKSMWEKKGREREIERVGGQFADVFKPRKRGEREKCESGGKRVSVMRKPETYLNDNSEGGREITAVRGERNNSGEGGRNNSSEGGRNNSSEGERKRKGTVCDSWWCEREREST